MDEASKNGKVAAIFPAHDTQPIQNAKSGDELAVILTNTAFHAEGGGQLGDTGRLVSDKGIFNVTDTKNCRTATPSSWEPGTGHPERRG